MASDLDFINYVITYERSSLNARRGHIQVSAIVAGVLRDWVEKHQGPSGAPEGVSTHRRPTAYSTKPEDACNLGILIINEL